MSDLNRDDFPSNSHKNREERERPKPITKQEEKPPEKRVEKVVSGKVVKQKKSFGRKLKETFFGETTGSVREYVIWDVLIPSARDMIADAVKNSIDMLLFGEKRGRRTTRDGGRSYTNYGTFSQQSYRDRERERDQRDISRTGRARFDFNEIVFETRGEAEEVLSHLVDLTMEYKMATVADLYDLSGISSNHTDRNYGWTSVRDATVDRVRDGYIINLPRPKLLD